MLRTQTEELNETTLQRLSENDPSLTDIECPAGQVDTAHLAKALKNNRFLKSLSLTGSQDSDSADEILILLNHVLIDNTTLQLLNAYSATITTKGAMALASILNNNTTPLTHVVICINSIGADGLIALFRALKNNKTVTKLHLTGCLSDSQSNEDKMAVAEALGDMLASNQTLQSIYLEYLGGLTYGHHMTALANGLMHNKSIKKLRIEGVAVSVDKLVDALRSNRTLLELDLSRSVNDTDDALALAGLLSANTTGLTSIHLRGIVDNNIFTPIITALKHNTTLTSLDASDCRILYSRKLCELLVDALRINTTLLSVKYLPDDGLPNPSWPNWHSSISITSSIDSFMKRNKILAELSLAVKNGDAIATLQGLAKLKDACPDIDKPASTQPTHVVQAYRDYMILHPSTLSPHVVDKLLEASYPLDIQIGLEKALALYLFANAPLTLSKDETPLSLPEKVDANRYRMILWLCRNNLNDEEMREVIFMCSQALDASKNSSSFKPSGLSLNQLLNIDESENLDKIIEKDKKIILKQLRLLYEPATTVAVSAAVPVTGSGHGVFDSRTTASAAAPAAIAESDKAKRKDKSHTTVKKPK